MPRRRSLRLLAMSGLVLLSLGGCAGPAVYGGLGEARALFEARVVVMRWVAANYGLRTLDEPAGAYCLLVRPRVFDRTPNKGRRPSTLDPDGRLLSRLSDLALPVFPHSQCDSDNGNQERVIATGARAVAVTLDYPVWRTVNSMEVSVGIRDNQLSPERFTCELIRDGTVPWIVRRCA